MSNPKENTDLREQIYAILAGYEPVGDAHGNPIGYDLEKDNRTEWGFYWEYEDMREAAENIGKLVHQARVDELNTIRREFWRLTWSPYDPDGIFVERLKELESKEETD